MNEPRFEIEYAKAMLENIVEEHDWTSDRAVDLHVELMFAIGAIEERDAAIEAFTQRVAELLAKHDVLDVIRRAQITEIERLTKERDELRVVRDAALQWTERYRVDESGFRPPANLLALFDAVRAAERSRR